MARGYGVARPQSRRVSRRAIRKAGTTGIAAAGVAGEHKYEHEYEHEYEHKYEHEYEHEYEQEYEHEQEQEQEQEQEYEQEQVEQVPLCLCSGHKTACAGLEVGAAAGVLDVVLWLRALGQPLEKILQGRLANRFAHVRPVLLARL